MESSPGYKFFWKLLFIPSPFPFSKKITTEFGNISLFFCIFVNLCCAPVIMPTEYFPNPCGVKRLQFLPPKARFKVKVLLLFIRLKKISFLIWKNNFQKIESNFIKKNCKRNFKCPPGPPGKDDITWFTK